MSQSQVSVSLSRCLTALETWGFGLSGLLLWLGTAPAIHFALGAKAIWVWLPATIVGILLNLQVKQLGTCFPNVSGGTPNYTTRLLQQFPALARYSAIGYLLGWVSVPSVNAIILTSLIQENLKSLGLICPVMLLRIGFVILPFVVAFGGIRTLGILQAFFVFPAIGFLTTFCLQGIGWLSFSPDSPGLMPETWTGISAIDWMKWFFISTYAVYSCETASSFVSESRQPIVTLRCLSVTAGFIPIIYLAGSWVVMRLAVASGTGDGVYFSLVTAASPFWGTLAPALVTFLITCGCLLSSTTAVSNCPRILYQLALDGYLPRLFSVVSYRGVPEPSLLFTLFLSLLCLFVGNVASIVMITGTGYLLAIAAVHFGLWLGRKQPGTRWPWWSLGFCVVEVAVLAIGGLAWGWQALFIGVLLPFIIGSICTFLPRLGFAPFHPDWWQQQERQLTYRLKPDWIVFQVIILIVLICGAVSSGWLVRARLARDGLGNHVALFNILLIAVAFLGIAIACWTSLSQITAITEAQKTAEQTLIELQQQTRQAQALNRVVQSIRHSLDLPTIFSTATAEVSQLLNVHRTTIMQYVPARSCWYGVACHCLDESLPDITGLEIPDEDNLFATQIKQFQIVRINGIDELDDPVNQEIARQFPNIVWLIVPIVVNDQVWGGLSLSKLLNHLPWEDTEVELVGKIADQVAIAIQQAELYQQAQQELSQRQQAEVALQRLNQELEQRVQERTQQFKQEVHLRQQAEVKFQKIFHVSPHAIAIATLEDRRIIEVNEAFSQLFGYTRDEMLGHYVDEFPLFANPAHQGMVQRHLMAEGAVRNLECVYRTRTGEVRTGIASAEFLEVDGIPCFMVVANDITDRKRAVAALAQSEARFQKIALASPAQIYILVTDLKGSLIRFEYVSPAVKELRELSPEQLLQDPTPVYNQIHPDDRADYLTARNHSLATMKPFFHEYRIVPPSGEVKWIRVNSRPERRGNDEVFWYGIILDVSDRKRIEQERERFLAVSSSLQVITGSNGYFHWVSPSFEQILGRTPAEMTS
ncbi:MAG: PAS domain S-box protein, partial [Actinomycetota bacterium]